jgi:hypothetical protein
VEGERCEGRAGGLRRAGFEIMHAWIMVDEAMSEPQTADSTRIACKDGSGLLAALQNSLAGLITTRVV